MQCNAMQYESTSSQGRVSPQKIPLVTTTIKHNEVVKVINNSEQLRSLCSVAYLPVMCMLFQIRHTKVSPAIDGHTVNLHASKHKYVCQRKAIERFKKRRTPVTRMVEVVLYSASERTAHFVCTTPTSTFPGFLK